MPKKKKKSLVDGDEWSTPASIADDARHVLGQIDLDPASHKMANDKVIKAFRFFDKQKNGLDRRWEGKVWLNPPYSRGLVNAFIMKALYEWHANHIEQMIILVNASTGSSWFQELLGVADQVSFLKKRIAFWHPSTGGPSNTKNDNRYDQAVFHFSVNELGQKYGSGAVQQDREEAFRSVFGYDRGTVLS